MRILHSAFIALALSAIMPLSAFAQQYGVTTEKSEQNTPEGWDAVELPNISGTATLTASNTSRVKNIKDYGASESSEDNAKAIQKAINDLPRRGGVVVIPKGTWLSGCIVLKSKTILHLEKGATLKLLPMGKWDEGDNPFISCQGKATDVIVEGEDKESCVIDGQGAPWWAVRDKYGKGSTKWNELKRPGIIDFQMGNERFLVKNLTIKNSPTSNIRIGKNNNGKNFTVHDVIIREPASELRYRANNPEGKNPSHNTDGIPVWTIYVNIYNCDISNGDDNVVMDSGARFVHVWNCKFGTGHGASMGSFTTNMHDILWEDIDFDGTSAGFRLKSNVGRSGSVYNITMRNCTMNNVPSAVSMTAWYDSEPNPSSAARKDSVTDTPYFHDILIQNVTAKNVRGESIHLFGRPESYISNITFDNVKVEAKQGMFMAYCRGIKFVNGCDIKNVNNPTSYFSRRYKASWTGSYDGSDATGIVAPTINTVDNKNNVWYTLGGQRVAKPAKGIYIHNGKKVVMK